MIEPGSTGSAVSLGKLALALGKVYVVSAIPFALAVGMSVLVIASGAMFVAHNKSFECRDFETADKETAKAEQRRDM